MRSGEEFAFFPKESWLFVGLCPRQRLSGSAGSSEGQSQRKASLNTSAENYSSPAPSSPALRLPPPPSSLSGEAQKPSRGRSRGSSPAAGSPRVGGRRGAAAGTHAAPQKKTNFNFLLLLLDFGVVFFFLLCYPRAGGEPVAGADPPFPSRASRLPSPQPPAPTSPLAARGRSPFPRAGPARVISARAAAGGAGLPPPD